ncbi:MAG: endonuclease domain-containing protein [Chloroflexi bacterium]|nr:endonuclease domain-containing protein [Chloroflexota bacterium]MBU1751237.1 endonuclease domain-containing protein [Chloroflexota bacterium]
MLAAARELRQPQTSAEAKLWARLRDRRLGGFKFRRQYPIARFILDFCCPECCLAVELDGCSHMEPAQQEYDALRTAWLNEQGYRVIRFTNQDVYQRLDHVLEAILAECQQPSPPAPICVNLRAQGWGKTREEARETLGGGSEL